jgi:hypothetical protein
MRVQRLATVLKGEGPHRLLLLMTAICYVDDGYVDEFTIKFRFSISNKVLQLIQSQRNNIPVSSKNSSNYNKSNKILRVKRLVLLLNCSSVHS